MRKYFFLAILVTVLVIISCVKPNDEDDPFVPPTPPPVVELAPTIVLSVSSSSILYSTDVVVTWSSTNAKSVSINGESMTSTSGSKTYSSLITNTTFVALATNVTKTATDSKTVTVAEEPTPTAELTISPNDAVLPYGKDITVTWNITNFKTATLNGEAITQATGSKEFKQLLASKDFELVVTNFTKSVTTKKTVTVGDWTSSRFGLLTHGYWRLVRHTVWVGEVIYNDTPFDDSDKAQRWYFYPNFTYQVYNPDGSNVTTGVNEWGLDSDATHIIWGQTFLIEVLNENEFVISRVIQYYFAGTYLTAVSRDNFVR